MFYDRWKEVSMGLLMLDCEVECLLFEEKEKLLYLVIGGVIFFSWNYYNKV